MFLPQEFGTLYYPRFLTASHSLLLDVTSRLTAISLLSRPRNNPARKAPPPRPNQNLALYKSFTHLLLLALTVMPKLTDISLHCKPAVPVTLSSALPFWHFSVIVTSYGGWEVNQRTCVMLVPASEKTRRHWHYYTLAYSGQMTWCCRAPRLAAVAVV